MRCRCAAVERYHGYVRHARTATRNVPTSSEHEREPVLVSSGPIGLDAVDAIERPFELTERRRRGEQASGDRERQPPSGDAASRPGLSPLR
jgi:hypothetical protein